MAGGLATREAVPHVPPVDSSRSWLSRCLDAPASKAGASFQMQAWLSRGLVFIFRGLEALFQEREEQC